MLKKRKTEQTFHPYATQEIPLLSESVFIVIRNYQDKRVFALQNLSDQNQMVDLQIATYDLLSEKYYEKKIVLQPYQIMRLKPRL